MNKVHKSPISRIRTSQVDIRNIDALKAKGYTKGKTEEADWQLQAGSQNYRPSDCVCKECAA